VVKRSSPVVLLIVVALLASPAGAATPRASFNDIEDEVMCVTCNVPLNIAESPQAQRQKEAIRRYIAQGLTKDQIKSRLKRTYGPDVLALPDPAGFNLAAYAVPVAAIALVLAALAVLVPRWRRGGGSDDEGPDDSGPSLDPDDARRLDEDLARYVV
jgi:cytochrome c-type biogenesis protein CcmH/NrfF